MTLKNHSPFQLSYLRDKPEAIEILSPSLYALWGYHQKEKTLAGRIAMMKSRLNGRQVPTCVVASDGADILGTASLVDCDFEERANLSPWLATVYTAEKARGQGVGSALVSFIENEAQLLGFKKIYLVTPDKESFYARLGWSTFERVDHHGTASVLMEKLLK